MKRTGRGSPVLFHNQEVGRTFLLVGSILGFLAVALGAFGAHGLKQAISAESLAIFQTGVQYQALHALALLAIGAMFYALPQPGKLKAAGWLFTAGVVVFSGSLYILAVTGVKWLGAITPLGGLCFLSGWVCLIWSAASLPANRSSS